MTVSPAELAQEIGRGYRDPELPIRFYTRSPGLASSLSALVRGVDDQHLNYFVFNSIEDEELRHLVARSLTERTHAELDRVPAKHEGDSPSGLGAFLASIIEECGGDPRVLEPLVSGWRKWIADEAALDTRVWKGPFLVGPQLDKDPLPDWDLGTDEGRALRDDVRRLVIAAESGGRTSVRGEVIQHIRDLSSLSSGSSEVALDYRTVRDWYTRARRQAIAAQHAARLGSTLPVDVRPVGPVRHLTNDLDHGSVDLVEASLRVDLPEGFLDRVAVMSGDQYRQLFVTERDHIESWWSSGNVDALRRVVDALFEASGDIGAKSKAHPSRLTQWIGKVAGAAAGTGAVLITKEPLAGIATGTGTPMLVEALGKKAAGSRRRRRVLQYIRSRPGVAARS